MERLTIGIVGLGLIGQRWAAAFAHAGHDVRGFDPDPARAAALGAVLPTLFADLDALRGTSTARGTIVTCPTLADALRGVDFVQENGPEALALKQRMLSDIDNLLDEAIVVASSSSALLVSEMQAQCRNPQRIVLGHPFNPVHLMPLVEIVAGRATAPAALVQAREIYTAIGKKPVVLHREITGHLALRLMGAMWREAIALVRDGVASVEDVDRAFIYGPGPKWALQGAFISNGLNADGIESFLIKYGPTYQAIWDSLLEVRLDAETAATISASTAQAVGSRSQERLRTERDAGLIELLKTIAEHGAL
ncbi:3-hydroxyacyl-CoA dehydrogenase [Rhizobiales bacterium Sp-1]|uniref:3-hydroxyacyl-CoA dehydrogenase n=1 Tax=Segnochrobactrum spirostomi TaxID=2608987 RepID=A0A6A7YCH4_9HYPH|nr:3-hydroxyacyl-CoA dehydrogenase [Segnochrobactrum spirostomi]